MSGQGIRLDQATLKVADQVLIESLSVRIPEGEALVITGKNGVGKSTLLAVFAGLREPDTGSVRIGGHRPDMRRPSALVGAGVRRGVVFQHGGLISNLSAEANVRLPLEYHADVLQLTEAEITARVRDAMNRMCISAEDTSALPVQLSEGERKRVAFARLLAFRANYVFLDDPDAGLDADTVDLVDEVILELWRADDVTVVVTTSQPHLPSRVGADPWRLHQGTLVKEAEDGQLLANDRLTAVS